MATEEHAGGGGHGHGGPLSNDLPPKPPPWRPQIKGFRNTYFEDRLDWTPMKRDPIGAPDEETRLIAERLAARTEREREEREARQRY